MTKVKVHRILKRIGAYTLEDDVLECYEKAAKE